MDESLPFDLGFPEIDEPILTERGPGLSNGIGKKVVSWQ
jgi:hypothetical protein